MVSTISKTSTKSMVKAPQFDSTICLQARYQATAQAALFGEHQVRTGVLSPSKMVDGHHLDLEEMGDGPRRSARALSMQVHLFHQIQLYSRRHINQLVSLEYH